MLHKYEVDIDTDGSGDATDYAGGTITGKILAIKYEPGTLATGADLTITGNTSAVPILVKADAGTSDVWFYPRVIPNKNTDGSAFTDLAEMIRVFGEKIKIVTAQGGDTASGTITFYVEDDVLGN